MESLRHRDPEAEVHSELERLGQKHIGGPLQLEMLPYEPALYPDQELIRVHNPIGMNVGLDKMRSYARLASGENKHPGRFDYLVSQFQSNSEQLSSIKVMLADGKNIALVTNHSLLHDIAIAQAALVSSIDDPSLVEHNAIVISKLITRFKAFGQPATAVLGLLAHSFFSIPSTKSTFRSGIDKDISSLMNQSMRRRLSEFMEEPEGKLVAIAPSGSTDERVTEENDVSHLTLQRMSSGTADMLSSFDAVLPVAIWLEAEEHRHSISIGDLRKVTDENSAHDTMHWIAKQTSHLAGVRAVYESEHLGGLDRVKSLAQIATERFRTD